MRDLARAGAVDVVLAHSLDRLSRKQTHVAILVEAMEAADVTLDFVSEDFEDTAVGQLVRSVKAFAAEFEREKIAERTMRGKLVRARSGRLPQGTGRGCYGYRYNLETGQREVHEYQAAVVRRIFAELANGDSCDHITNALNAEGILAFAGGRWYSPTVRRLLRNEAYAGRTVYRKTRAQRVRDAASGRWKRRVVGRDPSEWIEVPGASPAIVDGETFAAAQRRLDDPRRRERSRPSRRYPLRGRLRCAQCGGPMVGQALGRGRYLYYRCRRSYAGPRDDRCASRYVPTRRLEEAVRAALADLLADPARILAEARRLLDPVPDHEREAEIERALAEVEAQQRRLVKLYTAGTVPDSILAEESERLAAGRARLEAERHRRRRERPVAEDLDAVAARLPTVVRALRRRVAEAEGAAPAPEVQRLREEIRHLGRTALKDR